MAEAPVPNAAPGAPGEPAAFVLPDNVGELVARARPLALAEVAVVPLRTRLNLRLACAQALDSAGSALALALPAKAGTFAAGDTGTAIWLGPDEWFFGSETAEPAALLARLGEALGAHASSLVDVSERSLTFALTGSRAVDVLNAGCPLDLSDARFPVGSGTRTVLGKSEIVLWRPDAQTYHIDVWRSYAPYVFAFLDEARRELRG